jgi:Homeodomain-like domain
MDRLWSKGREIAVAQRCQIIQRVLVDGWSAAQAAEAFDIQERQVARWVAVYRRHGMASLREDYATDGPQHRWMRALRGWLLRCFGGLRRIVNRSEPAQCIVLRRTGDDPHH